MTRPFFIGPIGCEIKIARPKNQVQWKKNCLGLLKITGNILSGSSVLFLLLLLLLFKVFSVVASDFLNFPGCCSEQQFSVVFCANHCIKFLGESRYLAVIFYQFTKLELVEPEKDNNAEEKPFHSSCRISCSLYFIEWLFVKLGTLQKRSVVVYVTFQAFMKLTLPEGYSEIFQRVMYSFIEYLLYNFSWNFIRFCIIVRIAVSWIIYCLL